MIQFVVSDRARVHGTSMIGDHRDLEADFLCDTVSLFLACGRAAFASFARGTLDLDGGGRCADGSIARRLRGREVGVRLLAVACAMRSATCRR